MKRHGRRTPYTETGIRRLPCVRCGKPASQQWRACADGLWRPICTDCDILLNRLALVFMGDPEADNKIDKYEAKLCPKKFNTKGAQTGRFKS